jgi:N-acetylmuramoyl-L-alanine amidase
MRRAKIKISLFLIFITLTIFLPGCGVKNLVDYHSQDIDQTQDDNEKIVTNSAVTARINENSNLGGSDKNVKDTAGSNSINLMKQNSTPAAGLLNLSQNKAAEKTSTFVFKEVSETVYATANVNIRSAYSTTENNVVSVLKKGSKIKRIGVQEEWSRVLYQNKICYIKTNYLTLKKPVKEAAAITNTSASDINASSTLIIGIFFCFANVDAGFRFASEIGDAKRAE